MAMSVRERIKEIGVLRTLGFTTDKVLAMIIAEAVIIAMVGGLLGCLLAFVMVQVMGSTFQIFFGGLRMPPVVLLISLGVAFAIGLLSSVVPAYNASRLPITDALRHVG